jgi:hypothetical protein
VIDSEIARAIDEHLLRPCDETAERVSASLAAVALTPEVCALVTALRDNHPSGTTLTPAMLGSYLASRLMSKSFSLADDHVGCLYALADAVKAIDAVAIYRWCFVVSELSALRDMHAAATLLRQARRFLDGIVALSPDMEEELRWERRILPMS